MKFFKKFLALIKFSVIGVIWSYIYLCCTLLIFKFFWDFNYLSRNNWRIISTFWNEGGKIRTGSDFAFILCLLLLIPLWIWGWKKLYKANILQLLLNPVFWFQNRKAKTYLSQMSKIKLHNIGASVGAEIKQNFENELKQQQKNIENTPKVAHNIRSQIKNKLTNRQ